MISIPAPVCVGITSSQRRSGPDRTQQSSSSVPSPHTPGPGQQSEAVLGWELVEGTGALTPLACFQSFNFFGPVVWLRNHSSDSTPDLGRRMQPQPHDI